MMQENSHFKIAVLFGGPSPERGISLNSARSVCDHIRGADIELIYFDRKKRAHHITRPQLYSNTPDDFDFKLRNPLTREELSHLLHSVDLVFPVIHGEFGEDGAIQKILEEIGHPFIGSSSEVCQRCFDKYQANEILRHAGFDSIARFELPRNDASLELRLQAFWKEHPEGKAVVKPGRGGSSMGVAAVGSLQEAREEIVKLWQEYDSVVLEPFLQGTEFTAVVLENRERKPVCLIPVEVEAEFFTTRKKYLATNEVFLHCPPRFAPDVTHRIQDLCERVFRHFSLRDFCRLDGWLLPDGRLCITDINLISGMEQNSFLFLQGSRVGMTHQDILQYIIESACRRYGIACPLAVAHQEQGRVRQRVNVLFGGNTAERQVSVMSGTNVWLKLLHSSKYDPYPYLLDADESVWELPYTLALTHTVEEMRELCKHPPMASEHAKQLQMTVAQRLGLYINPGKSSLSGDGLNSLKTGNTVEAPRHISLDEFIRESEIVFIGLHGGIGENGELQARLEAAGVRYNGSGPDASRLCMDKYRTGEEISKLSREDILTAPRQCIPTEELLCMTPEEVAASWNRLCREVAATQLIVKPVGEGCSSGVAKLSSAGDLQTYLKVLERRAARIPANTLSSQPGIIEMSPNRPEYLLFEKFIGTDRLSVEQGELKWEHRTGWVEITVGVIGRQGEMRAFNPSITIAENHVLSVEEKFQGGMGINITPPPPEYVPPENTARVKEKIETVAAALGLAGYARIDAFLNIEAGHVLIIEVNSLPGLTPSTVIYQQALAEPTPIYPGEFLEKLLDLA